MNRTSARLTGLDRTLTRAQCWRRWRSSHQRDKGVFALKLQRCDITMRSLPTISAAAWSRNGPDLVDLQWFHHHKSRWSRVVSKKSLSVCRRELAGDLVITYSSLRKERQISFLKVRSVLISKGRHTWTFPSAQSYHSMVT